MKNKEINKQSNVLITCISCMVVLMVICYFGVGNSSKATYSATTSTTTSVDAGCNSNYPHLNDNKDKCYSQETFMVSPWVANKDGSCTRKYLYDTLEECEDMHAGTCYSTTDSNGKLAYAGLAKHINCWTSKETIANHQCYECTMGGITSYSWVPLGTDVSALGCSLYSGSDANTITKEQCWAKDSTFGTTLKATFEKADGTTTSKTCNDLGSGCAVDISSLTDSKSGYTFEGWGTTEACTSVMTNNIILTANRTYYACFSQSTPTATKFTVTFKNGSTTVATKTCETTGESCSVSVPEDPTKSGYTFKGWGTNSTCTAGNTKSSIIVEANTTYYACWAENSKTLTATFKNGSTTVDTKTCDVKGTATSCEISAFPSNPTKSGYTFKGWSTSSSCTSTTTSKKLTANTTYYACFTKNEEAEKKTYTLTFKNGNTTVATKQCTETTAGSGCSIDAFPSNPTKSGYTFKGWSTSSSCTSTTTSKKLTANDTYYACFTANTPSTTTRVATFKLSDGTTSTLSCQDSGSGCQIDLSKASDAKAGYTFKGWTTSTSACTTGSTSKVTIKKDTTYYPCFTKVATSGGNTSTGGSSNTGNNNVNENPKTGSVAIFLVWVLAIGTLVYSFFYFKKIRAQ